MPFSNGSDITSMGHAMVTAQALANYAKEKANILRKLEDSVAEAWGWVNHQLKSNILRFY